MDLLYAICFYYHIVTSIKFCVLINYLMKTLILKKLNTVFVSLYRVKDIMTN